MATPRTGFVRWGIMVAMLAVLAIAGTAVALAQGGPGGRGPAHGQQGYTIHLVVDGTTFRGFVGISGLSSESEVLEFAGGSDPNHVAKIPGRHSYGDITLKRGLTGADALWDWRLQVVAQSGDIRKDITVEVFDQSGAPVAQYKLINAWPSKWEGPTLSGEGREVAIESITLTVEGIDID